MANDNSTGHDVVEAGKTVVGHVVAIVVGFVLMVVGLALGVTAVLLPVGLPIGLAGLLLFGWGLFDWSRKRR